MSSRGTSNGATGEVTAPLPPSGGSAPPAQRRDRLAAVVEEIRKIPGVECATLHGKDGEGPSTGGIACPAAPIEKESVALSRLAKRLGELFRTGDLVAGTVQGSDRNVLLLAIRDSQLTVLVAAGSDAGAVEDRIRALLGARG
jgi:predicted regulator of Ras-like GTPase activity (Roadblock/LC7/MglB family)